MRILTLTNFYPPHYFGGYELGCHALMENLRERGHQVEILTSDYRNPQTEDAPETGVHRTIQTAMQFGGPKNLQPSETRFFDRESVNERYFLQLCDRFQPDVLYCWNMAHLPMALPILANDRGLPVTAFVSDPWLNHWKERDDWYTQCNYTPRTSLGYGRRQAIRVYGRLRGVIDLTGRSLNLRLPQFASDFLRRAARDSGAFTGEGRVIHWGVDENEYRFRNGRNPAREANDLPHLLYVGQIGPHKGVHTIVEAINLVVRESACRNVRVTIVGPEGFFPDYNRELRQTVKNLFIAENVVFVGGRTREQMVRIYQNYDVLLFPSIWEEPFGITPLEAMASGLAIVATPTGGSPEIFTDGENALLFPASDARALSERLTRILTDAPLLERLRVAGRGTIEERFTFSQMADRIEESLQEVIGDSQKQPDKQAEERSVAGSPPR